MDVVFIIFSVIGFLLILVVVLYLMFGVINTIRFKLAQKAFKKELEQKDKELHVIKLPYYPHLIELHYYPIEPCSTFVARI